jgi:branched-subunit amino acid aminotransferase/4-amino-4-deoxychorismate lyase
VTTQRSTLEARRSVTADGCAWIDGEYLPMSEARISILDTGFVRSDLTYDVVGVWGGKFFRVDDHLDRLERGCEALRLEMPMRRTEVFEILHEVVKRSGLREAYVEIIVTRGVPEHGERDPRRLKPRLYAYAIPYVWIVGPELQKAGTKVVVARDTRRTPPGAIDPTVKNFQWGDFVRGLFEAYDREAWLPILTDGDGNVTEGPGFNVFAVVEGVLYTPALGVLEGITRMTVCEIAAAEGIETRVEQVPVSALYRASELFLTSTAGGVMPVSELDGQPVGMNCPGSVTTAIRDRYWKWHDDPRFTTQIDYGE